MFGSQILEVAIGLAVVFFVLALASSAATELISQILAKRSKDLRKAIGRIVAGQTRNLPKNPPDAKEAKAQNFVDQLYETSPIRPLVASAKRNPSYISSSAFAAGVMEYLESGDFEERIQTLPEGIRTRVEKSYEACEGRVKKVQAELESWFDQSMERLSGVYKRWVKWVVLAATVVIVLAVNADSVNIATQLWDALPLRSAIVEAAADVGDPNAASPTNIEEVADQLQGIEALGIPLLWDCEGDCGGFGDWVSRVFEDQPRRALGWIITILLVSLGAPFWYGALTQLTSLRSSGGKPAPASEDRNSTTSLLLREEAAAAATTVRPVAIDLTTAEEPGAPVSVDE